MSYDELLVATNAISRQAQMAQQEERKTVRQQALNSLMNRSAIPARYLDATLIAMDAEQADAFEAGREFVDGFDQHLRTGAGMVLWGEVGTGKTHLACAIANALTAQLRPVMYCTALEAVMLVKASWRRSGDGMTEYDVYERFGTPELLIIDEIGVQIGSDFERMVLTSIADTRSRNCLPTIIASNLAPGEMYQTLGERMFDRLVGFGAKVVHMAGRSRRLVAVGR